MIRAFLEHHQERAERGELTGLWNCHVHGLHSVVLHDEPGNRLRMFYAAPDHKMAWSGVPTEPMPLAIHTHHCDVKLVGIMGRASSRCYRIDASSDLELQKCRFDSAITGGGQLVARGRTRRLGLVGAYQLGGSDPSQWLEADELHTVAVPQGEEAAWLVIEGANDPDYQSVCYTNQPEWKPFGLYKKADSRSVNGWLLRVLTLALDEHQRREGDP